MEKYFHNVTNLDRESISRQCNDYTLKLTEQLKILKKCFRSRLLPSASQPLTTLCALQFKRGITFYYFSASIKNVS